MYSALISREGVKYNIFISMLYNLVEFMSARMTVKARLAAESLCKTATATCQCGLEISN